MRLVEITERLHNDGIFTGGPPHLFESGGRLQLSTLVREGIWPSSKMLDIGCGCLRAGYWIVHLLNPGCYFGIEPNEKMLQAGIERVIGPELRAAKRPRFDTNDRFDFSVFGEKFDVFLARSIWTHASNCRFKPCSTVLCSIRTRPRSFSLPIIRLPGSVAEWRTIKGRVGLERAIPPTYPA
jgi:SAM-dependent methyltransferase